MGELHISPEADGERLRAFTRRVLADLRAFEEMLERGMVESGVRRIGAEQEMVLIDRSWRPAPLAMEILSEIDDRHYTTELGAFNLECNLDPVLWGGRCLRTLERQLTDLIDRGRKAAHLHGAEVILTGILPTLDKPDLDLANMTPVPRYRALNDAMTRLRGGPYSFYIKGNDDLLVTHDSVMLEACNTSFQVHFQVGPEEFARFYNFAQAVAAPVMAVAVNSPLLFGLRLWRETRIALFKQAVDTRAPGRGIRPRQPRVSFGRGWVRESVVEIFREDISRFRALLCADEGDDDPLAVLAAGGVPSLGALRLFNGTVYRWMRPCYGVHEGKAHLRIENRVLPAGPTVVDEIANAALWLGLLAGLARRYEDIRNHLDFDTVHENFVAAARLGLAAQLAWIGRPSVPARELLLEEMLPIAREGLAAGGIDGADADRFLGVIEERVESGRTGAQWLLDSYAATRGASRAERLATLTAATLARQHEGKPVHAWPLARLEEGGGLRAHAMTVGQIMTSDLFTVNADEVVDLAACLMDWRKIRHVPVEDNQHRLVGLVTYRAILRLVARGLAGAREQAIPVSEIMQRNLLTVSPDVTTMEAIRLMRQHRISCLPVVEDDRLVGIVTERDFLDLAAHLLEGALGDGEESDDQDPGPG